MHNRVPALPTGSDAHLAAAAWACEMTALEAAAEAMTEPPLWRDFDALLRDLERGLADIAAHLAIEAPAERLRAVATGPLTRRYSKALEYEYSAGLREELLAQAGRGHAADIADALAMLEKAARESPLLERALARASSEN